MKSWKVVLYKLNIGDFIYLVCCVIIIHYKYSSFRIIAIFQF